MSQDDLDSLRGTKHPCKEYVCLFHLCLGPFLVAMFTNVKILITT